MTSHLERFLPRAVGTSGFNAHDRITRRSVTMFVDIAGFTTLSEQLAARGTAGTEQLGNVLSDVLGRAMDLVDEAGGDTLSFGGDAILCAFAELPGDGDGDGDADDDGDGVHGARSRARRCAELIVELVASVSGRSTLIGPLQLSVKVGISDGSVTTMACRHANRAALVHLGPGLDAVAAAEGRAVAGEIIEQFSHVDAEILGFTAVPPDLGAAVVPSSIAHRVAAGGAMANEHRRATTVFVALPATDPDDADALGRLDDLVSTAVELFAELGGELIYCVGGDKGLVMFGFSACSSPGPMMRPAP